MNWDAFVAAATVDQVAITIFSGMTVVFITSKTHQAKRWGPICGLIAQPFWLYATAKAGQWGMFALSVYYTLMWVRGIINDWNLRLPSTRKLG